MVSFKKINGINELLDLWYDGEDIYFENDGSFNLIDISAKTFAFVIYSLDCEVLFKKEVK